MSNNDKNFYLVYRYINVQDLEKMVKYEEKC